jgi:hypothetical protein
MGAEFHKQTLFATFFSTRNFAGATLSKETSRQLTSQEISLHDKHP